MKTLCTNNFGPEYSCCKHAERSTASTSLVPIISEYCKHTDLYLKSWGFLQFLTGCQLVPSRVWRMLELAVLLASMSWRTAPALSSSTTPVNANVRTPDVGKSNVQKSVPIAVDALEAVLSAPDMLFHRCGFLRAAPRHANMSISQVPSGWKWSLQTCKSRHNRLIKAPAKISEHHRCHP